MAIVQIDNRAGFNVWAAVASGDGILPVLGLLRTWLDSLQLPRFRDWSPFGILGYDDLKIRLVGSGNLHLELNVLLGDQQSTVFKFGFNYRIATIITDNHICELSAFGVNRDVDVKTYGSRQFVFIFL